MEASRSYIFEKYKKLCNFMEGETLGTEVLLYGTSGLMLAVAYAKRNPVYLVRPFKKPPHIPGHLIDERILQTGLVRDVQQKGGDTLLMVSHRPLIPFFMSNNSFLLMKLPGVKVNGNGISWLQNCVVGREALFIALNNRASQKYATSQLCLIYPPKGNRLLDISETLLKLQFAHLEEGIKSSVKRNGDYFKHLKNVESTSRSRQALLTKISHYPWFWKALHNFRASFLPKEKLLPELVR